MEEKDEEEQEETKEKTKMFKLFSPFRLFMFSFVLALGAAFVGAPSIHNDVESGVMLAILPRPVRRSEVVLGKWLGLALLIAEQDQPRRQCLSCQADQLDLTRRSGQALLGALDDRHRHAHAADALILPHDFDAARPDRGCL